MLTEQQLHIRSFFVCSSTPNVKLLSMHRGNSEQGAEECPGHQWKEHHIPESVPLHQSAAWEGWS